MYFSGPDLNFGGRLRATTSSRSTASSPARTNPIAPYHAHAYDAYNIIFDAIEAVGLTDADGTLYIPRTRSTSTSPA